MVFVFHIKIEIAISRFDTIKGSFGQSLGFRVIGRHADFFAINGKESVLHLLLEACRIAAATTRWLQFLNELLYEEDIPALQEYIGYCLLPVTKAQKMLLMVGKGGEGKSRIGLILRELFGSSMYTGSLQKVETNRFARAD